MWFSFELIAAHRPVRENMLADNLSRNRLSAFLFKAPSAYPAPVSLPPEMPELLLDHDGWTSPSWTRLFCANRGLPDSTQRTYRSGLNSYLLFCFAFRVPNPFPVSERLLCYFVTSLAQEGQLQSQRTWWRLDTPRS